MDAELYRTTVPFLKNGLSGLRTVLEKAKQHGVDEAALLSDRLAPDMFPMVKQVQVACDHAKGAVARLGGTEPPKFEDTESTLEQLIQRVDATVAYISGVTEQDFEGASERKITLPYFPGKFLTSYDYVHEYAVPNFFFHVAMAYALVRKHGVAIGKADYIHNLTLQDLA